MGEKHFSPGSVKNGTLNPIKVWALEQTQTSCLLLIHKNLVV